MNELFEFDEEDYVYILVTGIALARNTASMQFNLYSEEKRPIVTLSE